MRRLRGIQTVVREGIAWSDRNGSQFQASNDGIEIGGQKTTGIGNLFFGQTYGGGEAQRFSGAGRRRRPFLRGLFRIGDEGVKAGIAMQ